MLLNIVLFILGMLWGAGFAIKWCDYQLEKAMEEKPIEEEKQ